MKSINGKFVDLYQVINMISNMQKAVMEEGCKLDQADRKLAVCEGKLEITKAIMNELLSAGIDNSFNLSEL